MSSFTLHAAIRAESWNVAKLRKAYDRVLDPSAISDREDTSEEERRKTKERKMRKDIKASKTEKKRRKGMPDFRIFEGKDLYQ